MMKKNKLFRESIEKICKEIVAGGVRRGSLLIYEKLIGSSLIRVPFRDYTKGIYIYISLSLQENMRLNLKETSRIYGESDKEIFLGDIPNEEAENDVREILKVLSDPATAFDFFARKGFIKI